MGPLSYVQSVIDRKVVVRRMTVLIYEGAEYRMTRIVEGGAAGSSK
jgi:hypothetical protein